MGLGNSRSRRSMTDSKQTMLVLGATGNIGGQVARQLLASKELVRVGIRTPSKGDAFKALGAEVAAFDWDNKSTWAGCLDGVKAVFCPTPFTEKFTDDIKQFLDQAKVLGVTHVVKLSAAGVPKPGEPNPLDFALGLEHGTADVEVTNFGGSVIAANFFMSNPLGFQGASIEAKGEFYGCSAGKPVSYVDPADIGAVAVKVLVDPVKYGGKTFTVTGAPITDVEVAELLSEHLGKPVKYIDIPPEAYLAANKEAGVPEWMAVSLKTLEMIKGLGYAGGASPAVQEICGRPPVTFKDYLAALKK